MLKKRISFLMVLAMLVTLMFGTVPANAKEGFVASGYTIMDSAYNDGTYVLMAKNFNDGVHPAKIYTSRNGKDWVEVLSVANGINYGNRNARQELLWWEAEECFVAQIGGTLYVSSDATTWESRAGVSNGIIETNGNVLVNTGGTTMKIYKNFTDEPETVKLSDNSSYYVKGIALSYESERYLSLDQYTLYAVSGEPYTRNVAIAYPNLESQIWDAACIPGAEKWVVTLGSDGVRVWNTSGNGVTEKITPTFADASVNTAAIKVAAADNKSVIVGNASGEILFTSAEGFGSSSVWEKAAPAKGTSAITSEITTISATENGEFIVATATDVYTLRETATGYEYADMLSYKEIEEAKVIGTLPFDGVSIMGGVYSPDLDRYVVYGNDADGKGHIFYSDDGINWNTTGVGTTTKTWGADEKTKNVIVWWPAQGMFVLSTATQKATQTCWYSKDGISWSFTNNNGFGDNGDISISGDYLFSSYKGSNWAIRRFATVNSTSTFDNIFYTVKDSNKQACTTMAVSDDAVPVVLVGSGYGQTFINQGTLDRNGVTNATLIAPGGTSASSQMRDVHWNTYVDKFVGVNSANSSIYLIDANANFENITPNADSGILAAIDTNGASYLTGGANGTIYYSNTQNISTSSTFTAVPANGEANTLPVTNIFAGKDGKYFVTVSDGVESDILIVNADGSSYSKASDLTVPETIEAGDTIKIAVKTANYTESTQNIRLIAAIYDVTGTKLLQVVSEEKTMGLNKNEIQELEVTVEDGVSSDSKLKVFIWDSLNGMVPVADAKAFF